MRIPGVRQGERMILRVILAFLVAVVVTVILGAAASSGFVLAELTRLGVEISIGAWLSTLLHDVVGMGPLYVPIVGVGFLIGFVVAAAVIRWLLPGWQDLGYPIAGCTAMLVILLSMTAAFGLMPIAGARSMGGLVAQCAAGAVGGYVFARLGPGAARAG